MDFFRRYCEAGHSVVFYLLAMDLFLFTYGVYNGNHLIVGLMVFFYSLLAGLVNAWTFLRFIAVGLCIIGVMSCYEQVSRAIIG